MKRMIISIVSLLAFAMIHSTHAAPPHGKSNIRHCGCVVYDDGSIGMAFVDANVSSKAKGHNKHGAGTIDSCFDGVDTFIDYQRTAGDCQVGGTPLVGPGLPDCGDTIVVGDVCGEPTPE
ncbi:MAG: hypothetical protein PVH25_09240 [Burkholderiales bacterium]|jgi:hypothetical protein